MGRRLVRGLQRGDNTGCRVRGSGDCGARNFQAEFNIQRCRACTDCIGPHRQRPRPSHHRLPSHRSPPTPSLHLQSSRLRIRLLHPQTRTPRPLALGRSGSTGGGGGGSGCLESVILNQFHHKRLLSTHSHETHINAACLFAHAHSCFSICWTPSSSRWWSTGLKRANRRVLASCASRSTLL